ncbi:MAG TPA: PPOX class F420-dependent oxidoreductase [Ktedonobacteraceae bacterium]|nr:PPOX class F420-dependent oxidoreductase [Ktedonobacteraceae bacterium]
MSENTTHTSRAYLTTPGKGHMTLLTSFRRNGQGVGTPVGTVASGGKLYFMTAAETWKVKRLAHNPHVTLALGTRKGEALGPAIEGTARRLYDAEARQARKLLRVGIVGHFFGVLFDLKYPGEKTAVYEIVLDATDADPGSRDVERMQATQSRTGSRER